MYQVSETFAAAMKSRPYIARITLDGVDTLQGDAVREIIFRRGANADPDMLTLGSAVAGSVELTLDQALVGCPIEKRELFVELGMELASGKEWIPMGKYTAQDPVADDGVLTVTALDALGAKLDVPYEPLEGFDFASGVSSTGLLAALCARRGVSVDTAGLERIALQGSPEGFTERQIVGFISALYGGFAQVDRQGVLRICRYTKSPLRVTEDDYYEDGLEKAVYGFTAGWIKCYNPATELNMFLGDMDAPQGIRLESIWMPTNVLAGLWEQLEGYTYRPVPSLSFLGDPRIDPGDILTLEDAAGASASVPVMTLTQEYDGGLITTITAPGQAVTEDRAGPTRQAILRTLDQAKSYTHSETAKLDQMELLKRLTKEWVDDGLYLTEAGKLGVNASAILVGILDAAVVKVINLIAEQLKSVRGDASLSINGAELKLLSGTHEAMHLSNLFADKDNANPILYMTDFTDGVSTADAEFSPHHVKVGGTSMQPIFELNTQPGYAVLSINGAAYKQLDWKANSDGTFTLIGR